MLENKCPVCGFTTKVEREDISEWVSRWDESQWSSREWRQYLISTIRDGVDAQKELSEIKSLYEGQVTYIKHLEMQLDLLQKTLDVVAKNIPRCKEDADGR
jgi:hypothetical protein